VRNIDRMPIPPHGPIPLDEQARAAAERDAGVRRVRRATRWMVAGAIGLTGAIAGVAAQQTLPASASTSKSATTASSDGASSGYTDDGGSPYDDGSGYSYDDGEGTYSGAPQAPAQAPQSAPQAVAPSTSSGAS
jgi:hypothetical protein